MYRDQREITYQWGEYFKNLYSPATCAHYDDDWYGHVTNTVTRKKRSLKTDSTATVLPEDVENIIKSCPNGKAPGIDCITYEHLKTAADIVAPLLASLYTGMLKNAYTPDTLKQDIIITLHKGGRKRKDEPNSYRAITLTSVILKINENVLLNRCKLDMLEDLNLQQGGFHDNLGCIMTSFILRESIFYAKENNSAVYVCFLHGKQAFDRVWHSGLFYKLCEKN